VVIASRFTGEAQISRPWLRVAGDWDGQEVSGEGQDKPDPVSLMSQVKREKEHGNPRSQ